LEAEMLEEMLQGALNLDVEAEIEKKIKKAR
jgi:hypothetical protein